MEGFVDVRMTPEGIRLPLLKWRELVFIGAMRPLGDRYVRDPSRPMPPFAAGDILPVGAVFRVRQEKQWVLLERQPGGDASGALGKQEP